MAAPPYAGQQLYPGGAPQQQSMSMQASATTVVVQQPVATGVVSSGQHPSIPQNQREFSSGLCDCFGDVGSCCFGYWCLYCLGCTVATRLGENACCAGCCMAPETWIAMRTKLRTMYGIQGSVTEDACCMLCCTPLAMCQMARELDHVGL